MQLRAVRSRATAIALLLASAAVAQAQIVTTPRQQFGFDIGDDYQLANYTQFADYWHKLDRESDRMTVVDIGRTAEGRPQLMAIVTSPGNQKNLERYKGIARRLALADGLTDEEARALAREGKAVVWIDGGLHATEVLGAHQLIETIYRLVSGNDPETVRVLDDVIVLAVHANPDGMDLVSNWYMRNPNPQERGTGPGIPRLYQKYIGHDNNRDFYLSSQPETTNMNRVMYLEWFPQIIYNHHQTGPAGTVMFAPPFRDPFNYNFDPLVPAELDLVAAAMHSRFAAEGKPGVTSRQGSSYSTWWNGGLRTMGYFHNMIGLLTETIGNPTPIEIPFLPQRHLPNSSLLMPVAPQKWHFRQSIEYSVTANYAVFDIASRNRENFLFNIYRMGKNSIERGSRDSWTPTPRRIRAAAAAVGTGRPGTAADYSRLLRDPSLRDPRGYILPSDQPDFPTATQFVNALLKTGIAVHRATAPFSAGGKSYPQGSYVVKAAQAFRPHVLDMFEPQDHPDDIPYPGGPPTRPYDIAGWTLAYQMGVRFDRILEGFDGPFEKVEGLQKPPAGAISGTGGAGFLLAHASNAAFTAVNRLLGSGADVSWITSGPDAGMFFVAGRPAARALVQTLAADLGVSFQRAPSRPRGGAIPVRRPRVALADRYGGSMPSGWTRWILEQFEFPFDVVYPGTLAHGDLSAKYDVIVFPSGIVLGSGAGRGAQDAGAAGGPALPDEYAGMQGAYTIADTLPQLRRFVQAGGTIVAVGSASMNMAQVFELPVSNHLVERSPDGASRPLPPEKFYIPGSVLRLAVDTTAPVAHGVGNPVDVFFDNSAVFTLAPDAALKGVRVIAWFDTESPLRSGWALGQGYLKDGVGAIEAAVGTGKLFLFGPEITFRAQPHGTFKFLFNAIYLGGAKTPRSAPRDDSP